MLSKFFIVEICFNFFLKDVFYMLAWICLLYIFRMEFGYYFWVLWYMYEYNMGDFFLRESIV